MRGLHFLLDYGQALLLTSAPIPKFASDPLQRLGIFWIVTLVKRI